MKTLTKIVLAFTLTMLLVGCVVSVNNNFGDNNTINKKMNDLSLQQEYDSKMKKGIK